MLNWINAELIFQALHEALQRLALTLADGKMIADVYRGATIA
jgi:hypothetical protein